MSCPALELHSEAEHACHTGACLYVHLAGLKQIINMHAVALIYLVILKSLHHGGYTAVGLLTFLKAAVYGSLESVLKMCEQLHGSQLNGHMYVMAAGMAASGFLGDTYLFVTGKVDLLLLNGKSVYVSTEKLVLAGLSSLDKCDDAGTGKKPVLKSHLLDLLDEDLPGLMLLSRKLRMLMELTAHLHHIVLQRFGISCYLIVFHNKYTPSF